MKKRRGARRSRVVAPADSALYRQNHHTSHHQPSTTTTAAAASAAATACPPSPPALSARRPLKRSAPRRPRRRRARWRRRARVVPRHSSASAAGSRASATRRCLQRARAATSHAWKGERSGGVGGKGRGEGDADRRVARSGGRVKTGGGKQAWVNRCVDVCFSKDKKNGWFRTVGWSERRAGLSARVPSASSDWASSRRQTMMNGSRARCSPTLKSIVNYRPLVQNTTLDSLTSLP